MGESTGGKPYERILEEAYERFEEAEDFTVSVEEEFALLDPETLDLVNRFEDVQAAARGTALEPNLVGELIASEVGGQDGQAGVVRGRPGGARGAARASSPPSSSRSASRSARPGRTRGRAGATSASSTRRTTAGTTRSCATSSGATTRSASTPTSRSGAPTARCGSPRRSATGCPELLAVSASSPFHEGVDTGLHSARTQVFTRFFPRCGVPDAFASWRDYADYVRFLYRTGSIDEPTQLWWSVRPHLVVPHRRAPLLRRAAGPRRGAVARGAHGLAHRPLRAGARRGRAAAGAPAPADRGEHVARDPQRALGRADRPRARRRAAGARAGRAADRVGAARRGGDRRRIRGCGSPSGTPRSARSRAAPRARASRRSTPSRCASPCRRAADTRTRGTRAPIPGAGRPAMCCIIPRADASSASLCAP